MNQLEEYRKNMPCFCEEVLKQVCVGKSHPMYQKYIDDAIWKYMYGDQVAESVGAFVDLPQCRMLDIGAGSGGLSTAFAKRGTEVIALDVDEGFERLSKIGYKENSVNVESRLFDGTHYPFGGGEFQILCCFNIFEHVPDVGNMFQEMNRVLAEDGFIIARMDYKWNWNNIKHDPHYGVFGTVLLPRWLRTLITVKLLKRTNYIEDYKWAPSFNGVKKLADKYGFNSIACGENVIFTKKDNNDNKLGIGNGKIFADNLICSFTGWYNPEKWEKDEVRWSMKQASLIIPKFSGYNLIEFEILSLQEKEVRINGEIHTGKTTWEKIVLKIDNNHTNITILLNTSISFVEGDTRALGIAIRNICIK